MFKDKVYNENPNDRGFHCIVMELIGGSDLFHYRRKNEMSFDEVWSTLT
jgi:hypothetical protein